MVLEDDWEDLRREMAGRRLVEAVVATKVCFFLAGLLAWGLLGGGDAEHGRDGEGRALVGSAVASASASVEP